MSQRTGTKKLDYNDQELVAILYAKEFDYKLDYNNQLYYLQHTKFDYNNEELVHKV